MILERVIGKTEKNGAFGGEFVEFWDENWPIRPHKNSKNENLAAIDQEIATKMSL